LYNLNYPIQTMLIDIFSRFDDHNFTVLSLSYVVWGIVTLAIISLISSFWVKRNNFHSITILLIRVVEELVFRRLGKNVGGRVATFCALFTLLVILNLFGLVPYIFSLTRHLAVNLAISLPLWLRVVIIGIFYDFGRFLAHLQPIGSPAALNPFLCLIELVRNLVRPITLSVRLTANLRTGHILIGLLGLGFTKRGLLTTGVILFIGIFYFIFEIGVCFIQAYIFTLLPTLYLDEHPRDSH
jgi:ATP synthase subunit 6